MLQNFKLLDETPNLSENVEILILLKIMLIKLYKNFLRS